MRGAFMAKTITTQKAPAALGPYCQAKVSGNLVFTSGQLGIDPATGKLQEGVEAQAKQSLINLGNVLEAAGSSHDKIVRTMIFLKDIGDFAAVNEVYKSFFATEFPARSCVQAGDLPANGLVEIECIAEI